MFKGLWFFIKFGWKCEKRYIIYLVLNQFINSLIPIIAVVMPRFIINELVMDRRLLYVLLYVSILVGYTLFGSITSNYLMWTSFTCRSRVAAEFDVFMHQKTVQADYEDMENSQYIEMKEKAKKFLFGDMKGFSYVLDIAVNTIGKVFTLLGVVAVIVTLNPLLVLIFILLVLSNMWLEAKVRKKQIDMSLKITGMERRWMYYGELMDEFSYGKEIRINGIGDWLVSHERKFAKLVNDIYAKSNSLGIKAGVFAAVTSFAQQCISYGYLVAKVINGAITIGDFSMYVGGVAAFSGAMREVMSSIVEISQYRKYYDAMEKYLNIPSKMRNNLKLPLPKGSHTIEFKNVYFQYSGHKGYALKNINLVLKPGQKLSIVGENGAGKTTFVKLLCRIYDPTEGEILLDGMNIKDIDYDKYMSLFSTVFQDFKLFSFSLKDNVALSYSHNAKDFDVEKALIKAGFGDKLMRLPKGIQTYVYKNFEVEGFEPSGGEGQKIALARALYKNAPIVVLDEPTAALDPKAEYEIYQHFNELVEGKTAIYISHRLSSTRFCDKIAVFDNGGITEYGTHEELLMKKGTYAQLFNMQAEFYTDKQIEKDRS
jgi:ABC-type multidrug transport system fused ATPase/permease subunit